MKATRKPVVWREGADSEPTVPCSLCGEPTRMTGTKLCDRCWEISKRIEADPVLAERALAHVTRRASLSHLQQAFAIAHRRSEDADLDVETRHAFAQVATLIWASCGKEPMPHD